ncbi:MAG: dCTP deaminase [bacterium]|jgi:dCTP deaminase
MATIVDHQIRAYAREIGLIEPFEVDQINPASYDVRLGPDILTEGIAVGPESQRQRWKHRSLIDGDYLLEPGEFILAETSEWIRIPIYLEAQFQLKSSRGREGYDHALAGYIDPGFAGKVTLEIHNLNRHHSLILRKGMLIGQLRFMRLDATPIRSYAQTGHYYGDSGVQPSKTSPW